MKYQTPIRPDELYHHGIKNQKWGVKNGPPYPLDAKVSKMIKTGANNARGESHYVPETSIRRELKQGILKRLPRVEGYETDFIHNHEKYRTLKNDDPRKSVLIANPYRGTDGGKFNCAKISTAMALRMMGYNVVGNMSKDPISGIKFLNWFEKVSPMSYDTVDDLKEYMWSSDVEKFGIIGMDYPQKDKSKTPDGHWMFYTNDEGDFNIYDGQDGTSYNSIEDCINQTGLSENIVTIGLTNSTPNWDGLVKDGVILSYDKR